MTIAEVVKQKTEVLAPEQQREVLEFVESLSGHEDIMEGEAPSIESVRQALAATAGMWKDRTDLPEDSVEAAQVLRDRAMARGIQ